MHIVDKLCQIFRRCVQLGQHVLAFLALVVASDVSLAQDAAPATAAATPEAIQARITATESNEELSDADRAKTVELYKQALADLETTATLTTQLQEWTDQTQGIAEQKQQIATDLASEDLTPVPPGDTSSLDQQALDEAVQQRQTELAEITARLQQLQDDQRQREERQLAAPQLLSGLAKAKADLESQSAEAPPNAPMELRDARKISNQIKLNNIELQTQILKAEVGYYTQANELLTQRISLAQRRQEKLNAELAAWRTQAEQQRSQAAQQDVERSRTQVQSVAEELKSLADENVAFSEKLQALVEDIRQVNQDLQQVQELLTTWKERFSRVRNLATAQGNVTKEIGILLRDQRMQLPKAGRLRRAIDRRRAKIHETRSAKFDVEERLIQLENIDRRVDEELAKRPDIDSSDERLRAETEELLRARQKTLQSLQANYQTQMDNLLQLNIDQESLAALCSRFGTFIDQRILWIRSAQTFRIENLWDVPRAFRWLSEPSRWIQLTRSLTGSRSLRHLLVGLFVVACFLPRRHGGRQIQALGKKARTRSCRDFGVTLKTLGWTLLVALSTPALVAWVAWVLETIPSRDEVELAGPVSASAWHAAKNLWPLAFLWHVLRPQGLAEAHFQWSETAIRRVRNQLRWFVPFLIVSLIIYDVFNATGVTDWIESAARLALVAALLAIALFLQRLLSPRSGVFQTYLDAHRNSWAYRLRHIWYPLAVIVPLVLAVLSLNGFQYTAQRLLDRLALTGALLTGLLVLDALATRWMLTNRRTLARAQARERLAEAAAGQGDKEVDQGEFASPAIAETQVDLGEMNEQTRRLLTSLVVATAGIGVYLIWVEFLPALNRLNSYPVWPLTTAAATVLPDATVSDATSTTTTTATTAVAQGVITIGNLLGSIFILVLMWIAIRNIPGLLEIVVLQHLPLDMSLRFAITTVTRYLLILAGVGASLSNIGFGWSQLQWLAAAISFGLGFGLQEIFANFISGLILLFERPLRAGDIVTVGDVTGTVVQIRTRATTIQDWDRKELVVPNKEFITGRLLNWTLTDQVNRIVIQVGVAYGSDIHRCRELVLETVQAHPKVLHDPQPSVTFDLFGDSALNLTVRFYLTQMSDRLTVTHELHAAIYDRFKEAGIEIPFPQRDVHMHSA